MMRLLGVGPIDIISTTIMTTAEDVRYTIQGFRVLIKNDFEV